MKQFYETYKDEEKVSTLLTQIRWSSHLDIMSKTKSIEEKEFCLTLAITERLSVRELRCHFNTAYFERVMIADYSTKLIDKEVLRQKLHEFFEWQENSKNRKPSQGMFHSQRNTTNSAGRKGAKPTCKIIFFCATSEAVMVSLKPHFT